MKTWILSLVLVVTALSGLPNAKADDYGPYRRHHRRWHSRDYRRDRWRHRHHHRYYRRDGGVEIRLR